MNSALRYGVSVLSIAIAALVTRAPGNEAFPTPLFFAAIVVSTWFGGPRPGLVSVALATVALGYYFLPVTHGLSGKLPALTQFSLPALLTCWFVKKRRDAETSLRAARDGLEAKVEQRTAELTKEIAERKRAEVTVLKTQAELAHVNRVMTMGELATSIAHELNQPLMAVVVNGDACIEWLKRTPPNLDEARDAVSRMVVESSRAGQVIQRIRALSRKTPALRTAVDMDATIAEISLLANRELAANQVALTVTPGNSPPVLGDRVQLQQVILNLIVNGIEAMNGVPANARQLRISSGVDRSGAVLVTIHDSGPGIPPADVDRIFDAFFTTKPEGVGMGLSISRTIIESHGGRLWAENGNPGAILRFTLPTHAHG